MNIRTVTVELLRSGPRHNQLLSPLTQYLGVCGNAPAGRVTLPYEHRDMEQRLQDLNYGVVADDDPSRGERMLDRTGDEMAEILSLIPGLPGALNSETERPQMLTQLRIVLSASELAMLPFELSKVPSGAGASGTWLALQARMPVCITRHIRSVSAEGMRWPKDPRILFVAGPGTPFEEHRQALLDALAPWRDAEGSVGDRLVVLKHEHATIADIANVVRSAAQAGASFTHVHILAHGEPPDSDRYSPVGVALYGKGVNDTEVISGRRLATALSSVTDQGVGRPAVVTLATCKSATQTDVRTPDASVAHDLHDRGIPLVVASQFPLSVEGSVPFVKRFYAGQLRGEHPLVSLYDVRLLLHARMDQQTHDWASIVVYEAFPSDLPDQLEELRYWQTRRAQEGALKRVEALIEQRGSQAAAPSTSSSVQERYAGLVEDAQEAGKQLPRRGPYTLECTGLIAAGHKRLAEAAFRMAITPSVSETWRPDLFSKCLRGLDEARAEYWRATKAFLGPTSELARRKANLHWLLGQVLSLDVILNCPLDMAACTAARLAAEIDTESPNEEDRAWAYVSLSELALLRLSDGTMPPDDRAGLCSEGARRRQARRRHARPGFRAGPDHQPAVRALHQFVGQSRARRYTREIGNSTTLALASRQRSGSDGKADRAGAARLATACCLRNRHQKPRNDPRPAGSVDRARTRLRRAGAHDDVSEVSTTPPRENQQLRGHLPHRDVAGRKWRLSLDRVRRPVHPHRIAIDCGTESTPAIARRAHQGRWRLRSSCLS